ncbi:MAG TPA: XrtA system polysaccharide chain length determinant [Vicinamibacterales bacterium]|jgi:polysaccharide chain length determinant protein (PEP-CTERM system associated)|nr:XrtA system polysaccharide chain length determinant [Vicinamibacterales bacterium]
MLPGKKYTPDDYVRIAWRRRWYIAIPAVVIASATAVVSVFLPNWYRASTSILIIPQRVPENFVRPTVTADLNERLNMITQQILSRTRLERIVQEFNLYERERRRMIMEDVIEQMRRDINVNVARPRSRREEVNSFSVSFDANDARTAMRVTERIASLFVQENLEDRELLADQTDQFLKGQLEEARRRLVDQERKLQEFRQHNNGRLPDQVASNLQLLQGAQTRLQSIVESSNKDRDRLFALDKTLSEMPPITSAAVVPGNAPRRGSEPAAAGTASQQLDTARAELRALQLRLKPEHPDIGRAKRVIAELEKKADEEALQQPLSAVTAPVPVVVDRAAQQRAEQMRTEMTEIRQRLESEKREAARLQETIGELTGRVQSGPGLQSQLTELMRDYDTLQEGYTALLRKSEESKIAVNLERRQIGEQFKIIDGARLPEKPISPDRFRINMFGILGGLALGLGLVTFLEYRDTSFKSDDDVMTTLALPVLAVIPVMTNAGERRQARRRKLLLAASASVTCMLLAAAVMVVWNYRLLDRFLR